MWYNIARLICVAGDVMHCTAGLLALTARPVVVAALGWAGWSITVGHRTLGYVVAVAPACRHDR
jgi:hypothetical protein